MIPEIKKILYATDLSKNSAYAFFYAVDMAKTHDARIVIIHSVLPSHSLSYAGSMVQGLVESAKREERKKDLEEIKKGLEQFCIKAERQVGHPCVELIYKIFVPLGYPVEEILKVADEESCDAIVLGTHGKGFLRHTFLGSVAVKVLERTRKPVFVIPLPSEKTDIDWDKI